MLGLFTFFLSALCSNFFSVTMCLFSLVCKYWGGERRALEEAGSIEMLMKYTEKVPVLPFDLLGLVSMAISCQGLRVAVISPPSS